MPAIYTGIGFALCLVDILVHANFTAGRDTNVVVNPDHPDAAEITVGPETPVALGARLFGA